MDLREAMEFKAQMLRDMAADNLRLHRSFRGTDLPPLRELADWYEGRYMAYKRAAEMIRNTLEVYV